MGDDTSPCLKGGEQGVVAIEKDDYMVALYVGEWSCKVITWQKGAQGVGRN